MVRADLVAAVVFIVLGALILYGSWTMPRLEVRRIHPLTIPGLVPGLLSLSLIICGTLLAIRSLRSRAEGGWIALREALVSEGARRALVVVALVLIYTLGLVGRLPFWAATGIFVFAFITVFEVWITPKKRPLVPSLLWALGLAVVTAAAATYVFERLFLVRLP
jgi:putative tricarboxylic transport membrane protein